MCHSVPGVFSTFRSIWQGSINISSLLPEVYGKAASISRAANGFQATGVWPVDQSGFFLSENDFVPS
jgi:hypothetical protein